MQMDRHELKPPVTTEEVQRFKAGDVVAITGTIYTARDAAHKRLLKALKAGKTLPLELQGQVIYYVGPTPAKPGHVSGSAGPTTSGRMDPYTPALLKQGLKAMIGKGRRSPEVIAAMKESGAVYLGIVGGTAALVAKAIKKVDVVAYPDLGPEAIHCFQVEDLATIVLIDSRGRDLYEIEPAKYLSS
jgi:fumarate hydratase subunit beta